MFAVGFRRPDKHLHHIQIRIDSPCFRCNKAGCGSLIAGGEAGTKALAHFFTAEYHLYASNTSGDRAERLVRSALRPDIFGSKDVCMERRDLLRGPVRLLAFGLLTVVFAFSTSIAPAQEDEESYIIQEGKRVDLSVAKDIVALEFPKASDRKSAASDASKLGLEIIDDLHRAPNQVYVKGSLEDVSKVVKTAALGFETKPVFYLGGYRDPTRLVVIPDRIIVAFKTDPGLKARNDFARENGLGEASEVLPTVFLFPVLNTPTKNIPKLTVDITKNNPDTVRWAEPDMYVHLERHNSTGIPAGEQGDPLFLRQWHLENTSRNRIPRGTKDVDTDAPRAWNWNVRSTTTTGDGRTKAYFGDDTTADFNPGTPSVDYISVAVFDTGTDLDHEDWNINQTDPDNGDDPAMTIIHPLQGIDGIDDDSIPDADNEDSHGTSVAGVISSARNNGTGGIGIAPLVRIFTVRIFDANSVVSVAEIASLVQATNTNRIDIGNHSWGGPTFSPVLEEAFEIAFQAGRGNFGASHFASSSNDSAHMAYPALYDWTFSVGGVDDTGRKVSYASWGGKLDFVGMTQQGGASYPGGTFYSGRTGILTTDIMGAPGSQIPDPTNSENPFGNYEFDFNGTSAASPVVAGVAALVLAEFPQLRPEALFNLLASTADRYPSEYNSFPDDALAARLLEYTPPPDPEPPGEEESKSNKGTVGDLLDNVYGNPSGFRGNQTFVNFFADGFSHHYGYGHPNPYNAIAGNFAKSPLRDYKDPDTAQGEGGDFGELVLLYDSNFGDDFNNLRDACRNAIAEAEEIEPFDVEEADILACVLSEGAGFEGLDFSILLPYDFESPEYFSGVQEMGFLPYPSDLFPANFEFGKTVPVEDFFPGFGPVPYVIASSRPTAFPLGSPPIDAGEGDLWYNPRGRYLPGSEYFIEWNDSSEWLVLRESIETGLPIVIEFSIKYELGVFNLSTVPQSEFEEFDEIRLLYNGTALGDPIIGESVNLPPPPVEFPFQDQENDEFDILTTVWPGGDDAYVPDRDRSTLFFRTFRFHVPAERVADTNLIRNPDTSEVIGVDLALRLQMNSGASYIPQYDTADEPNQILEVKRDFMGFHLADMKVWGLDPNPDEVTGLAATDIAIPSEVLVAEEGTRPVFSGAENEVFFVGKDALLSGGASADIAGTVKTALADGGTRIHEAVNGLAKIQRDAFQLFTVLSPGSDEPNQHTPTEIQSLDVDPKTGYILYVKNGGNFEPNMWITSSDGYGERALLPIGEGEIAQDRGTRSAIFGRTTETIVFTNGDVIESVNTDGTNRQFVFESSDSLKLGNFDHLSSGVGDAFIVFSATNPNDDRGLYYIPRDLNTSGLDSLLGSEELLLFDWPNSDEREPNLSPDGSLLVFASNTIDQDGGTVPPPNSPYRIYVTSSRFIDQILWGEENLMPAVQEVELRRDTRFLSSPDPVQMYAAGRFPVFGESNERIAFTGFVSEQAELGEIAIVDIADPAFIDPNVPPSFSPLPREPLAAADAEPDNRITLTAMSKFDINADGWTFRVDSGFTAPLASSENGNLELIANGNNTSTYGFWLSPDKYMAPITVPLEDEIQNAVDAFVDQTGRQPTAEELNDIKIRLEFPLYLIRTYVRRTTDDPLESPTLRVRLNSRDLQEFCYIENISTTGFGVPDKDVTRPIDMLFEPSPLLYELPERDRGYHLALDITNFFSGDDPNGGFVIERIDVFRVPQGAIENLGVVKAYTFNSQSQISEWRSANTNPPAGFNLPQFTSTEGRLGMSVLDPTFTYGTWELIPGAGAVQVNPVGIDGKLFLKYGALLEADETSPFRVPQIRVRLSRWDYAYNVIRGLFGLGSGSMMPLQGQPRLLNVYLQVDQEFGAPLPYNAGFDVLSIEDFSEQPEIQPEQETSSEFVYMDSARFEVIRVANYPEAEFID